MLSKILITKQAMATAVITTSTAIKSATVQPALKERKREWLLKTISILLTAGVMITPMAIASDLPNGPHITITGSASIDAMPDMARISIEINSSAKDAITAKKQIDQRVSEYLTFLHNNGIQQTDINALNLRTMPEYQYEKGKSSIKGYRATRNVEVKLRQLDKLNSLLNGALHAGLNEIRQITLAVALPEHYQQQAREAAAINATRQAQQLADAFNSNLGGIYSITYHGTTDQPEPAPRAYSLQARAAGNDENAYETPLIHFTDQVSVVFQLVPRHPEKPAQAE